MERAKKYKIQAILEHQTDSLYSLDTVHGHNCAELLNSIEINRAKHVDGDFVVIRCDFVNL